MLKSVFVRRVTAFLIDCGLLFVVLGPLGFLIQNLFGWIPETGPGIWYMLLINFSLPVWIYFIVSDHTTGGATLGKRAMGLHIRAISGVPISWRRSLIRTAFKLLPWEIVHVSAFALSADMTELALRQIVGLAFANVLWLVYVFVAGLNRGARSVHDLIAQTRVDSTG